MSDMKELEQTIDCECNDLSCERKGKMGEVGGHIEDCSCYQCHKIMGKI